MPVFLISPARCDGLRAALLRRSEGKLGRALRDGRATIGDVFSWLSALYFRGKLTYARAFGDVRVIAAGVGLCSPDRVLGASELVAMGRRDIESRASRRILRDHAVALRAELGPDVPLVLLGSIATGKYTDVFCNVFGTRLMFPPSFVGRGDMSRGGLLLRAARDGQELPYTPVLGATLHGQRPPKLAPLSPAT